ncbi:MAG TPA: hypothetical protein VIN08_07205 [Ohtaekwangia sp.]|uniref:hypothetical protein n=1 Tax=Ohtaekwangia sp. TaxID=2066019 RepID=UPI002F9479A8
MGIELDKIYFSGLKASAELHAGGIFFCIVYRSCIQFRNNGVVKYWSEVVDPLSPMDDYDIEQIINDRAEGNYFFNDRGYIECHFDSARMRLTGKATNIPGTLAFTGYSNKSVYGWSEVFTCQNT